MQEQEKESENLVEVQKQHLMKRLITLFIGLILLVILIIVGVFLYSYFTSPEYKLALGAKIDGISISSDGKTAYVKLLGGSLDKNITKIRFVFTDKQGNEHVYETSEGVKNISVSYKTGFLDWLFGRQFHGIHDYEINSEEVGLENFNGIGEVSVVFEYETETGKLIETPPLDTKKPITPPPSGGGGSGGGDGGCISNKDCSYYYSQEKCGSNLNDGCNDVLNCMNCNEGFYCYIREGINNVCINNSTICTDSDNGLNYYVKGNVTINSLFVEDSCLNNYTSEYYCYFNGTGFEARNESYNCTYGCFNGACRIESCINECSQEGNNFCDNSIPYNCIANGTTGCLKRINLTECNTGTGFICLNGTGCFFNGDCTSDSNCSSSNGVCGRGICNSSHRCQMGFNISTTVCRASSGLCGAAENCTGSSATCPADINSTGDICRTSTGACDISEFCLGSSSDCSVNSFEPEGTLCPQGVCDGNGTCLSWWFVNNGNPIDNGDQLSSYQVDTIIDSDGNLIYFFSSKELGKIIGRLNKTKAWEIFSFDGWTSENKITRPLSESMLSIDYSEIEVFNLPNESNKIFYVSGSGLKSGLTNLDYHGDVYIFIFDNKDFYKWNMTDFDKYTIEAMAHTWIGLGMTGNRKAYDFDMGEKEGILISYIGDYGTKKQFLASRYDIQTKKWKIWNSTDWVEQYKGMTRIPVANVNIYNEEFTCPSIRNIPNTSNFILTYLYENQTNFELRTAKYDTENKRWFVWNGTWNENNKQTDIFDLSYLEFTDRISPLLCSRPTIVVDGRLHMFYQIDRDIYLGIYNNSAPSWNFEKILSDVDNFVVGLNQNEIWLVYRNGSELKIIKNLNGEWNSPKIIYSSETIYPLAINFVNGTPVIFIRKNNDRLYAISNLISGFWGNEKIRIPIGYEKNIVFAESNSIKFSQSFETGRTFRLFNETNYCDHQDVYQDGAAGHIALDSENTLYVPRVGYDTISIFPKNYNESAPDAVSQRKIWGDFWGYFSIPSSISVDNKRNKTYVTDNVHVNLMFDYTGRITIWDKENKNKNMLNKSTMFSCDSSYLTDYIPKKIWGFNGPTDTAIDEENGYLYVTDSFSNRIRKFNLNSLSGGLPTEMSSIGKAGTGNLEFQFPQGIDTDAEGNVYVVDTNNHRIQKFDENGNFILSFGKLGRGEGEFIYPYAISIDKVTNMSYVSDPYNHRIQKFDLYGNYIYEFGDWQKRGYNNLDIKFSGVVAYNNTLYVGYYDIWAKIAKFKVINFCSNNSDCPVDYPYCNLDNQICFECLNDAQCPSSLPACANFECVECTKDEYCSTPLPGCNTNNFECVQCTKDEHCSEGFCYINNTCINVGCLRKEHCAENEVCWFNNTCKAIYCVNDSECEDFDDCSEDKCINGYCNFSRFTNQNNCYYCANFSYCWVLNGMGVICGGADIDRNGSVGAEDINILQAHWKNVSCNETNNFCDYADINRRRYGPFSVYIDDLKILNNSYLKTCNLEPWRACELGIIKEEICDGFDNNCNNEVDEGCLFSSSFWKIIIEWVKSLFS